MIFNILGTVFKAQRFYVYLGVILVTGVGVRMLPEGSRQFVCESFVHVSELLIRTAGASTENASTLDRGTALLDETKTLFCPSATASTPDFERTPGDYLRTAIEVFPTAFALAALLVLLLPSATSRAELRADALDGRPEIDHALNSRDTSALAQQVQQLSTDAMVLAVRARQLRTAIVYAVASCLATVFFPPQFGTQGFSDNPASVLHVVALLAAAVIAGGWGLHSFATSNRDICTLAAQIAFAGVFFAGLIALAIAVPYRLLNTIEGADLSVEQVRLFAAMRLIVIPAAGALGGAMWLAWLRFHRGVPVRVCSQRPSQALGTIHARR